jgi:hypothetical protein
MKNYIRFRQFFYSKKDDFEKNGFNNAKYHIHKEYYDKIGITDKDKIIQLEYRGEKETIGRIELSLAMVEHYGSVYEIDEDVMRYICLNHAPPKDVIKKLRLPFKSIYIETELTRNDFEEINVDRIFGLLIYETEIAVDSSSKGTVKRNNLGRCFIIHYFCENEGRYWMDEFNIVVDDMTDDFKIIYSDKVNMKFLKTFLMNFILFVNDPEVEVIEHTRDVKNIQRRIKLGKMILPSSKKVRIIGRLKVYMDGIRKSLIGTGFSHRFWVRGHCRVLKSDWYTSKKGQVIWISPFIKGQGVLLKREYQLDMEKNDVRRRDLDNEEFEVGKSDVTGGVVNV